MSQAVLADSGVIATYGSMAAPEPQIPFYPMMFMNMSVRMVFAYTIPTAARRQAEKDIFTWLSDGSLKGIVADEFPLDQAAAAHLSVEAGRRIGVTLINVSDDA
jgi:NADPH:quinone reductase-like Zn-dependent oxidoreductase